MTNVGQTQKYSNNIKNITRSLVSNKYQAQEINENKLSLCGCPFVKSGMALHESKHPRWRIEKNNKQKETLCTIFIEIDDIIRICNLFILFLCYS